VAYQQTQPGEQTPDQTPDPARWRALGVCLVGGFMTLLDVSIVNVALPSIRSSLSATQSDLQWVLAGYALAFGLVLVPAGRLGDVRGRRTAYVVALSLFTAASAACGLAPTALLLSLSRVLQGVAGGLLVPQQSGLIQELFRGAERAKAFGLLGATIGISTAVGPLLGGLLIALGGPEHGWRLVFAVNVPIGLAAIPLALRLFPGGRPERRRESLDPVGVVLLGVGVLLILLPLVQERTWSGHTKWLLVPAGCLVLAGFVRWERRFAARGREPMIDLGLFRVRSYSLGTTLGLVYFAGFTAIFFIFTLFLQNGRGYSALQAGLAITPFALGSAAAAALGGRLVPRFGRALVAVGLLLVVIGLVGAAVAIHLSSGSAVGWAAAAPLLLAGVGGGFVITPNVTLTLSEVPVARAGSAGAVLQTGQRLGSAVGIALVGSLFFHRLSTSRGDWGSAVDVGLYVCAGFVGLALVLAVLDLLWGSRRRSA
jgi:EmrB/QacA subfamily drug resistance transporter